MIFYGISKGITCAIIINFYLLLLASSLLFVSRFKMRTWGLYSVLPLSSFIITVAVFAVELKTKAIAGESVTKGRCLSFLSKSIAWSTENQMPWFLFYFFISFSSSMYPMVLRYSDSHDVFMHTHGLQSRTRFWEANAKYDVE